jgi:ubiquinone/menaquinone biosynthesis C-methylase UbiE
MSARVGEAVSAQRQGGAPSQQIMELGGGTGITTLAILTADDSITLHSIDNEATMQRQAQQHLQQWVDEGRLQFQLTDALSALQTHPSNSLDGIASAYTLHNFPASYRLQVLHQVYRVLKPGAWFINGDRYALDDSVAHTQNTQREVAGYFRVLTEMQRLDLLEHWIIHLFSDESEHHIMRESLALQQCQQVGFSSLAFSRYQDVNALLIATK